MTITAAQQIALDNALQFWATINNHDSSYLFKIDKKRFFVNMEVFREILQICPRLPDQEFDEPPSEEDILFHQGTWPHCLDKIRLSRAQILWGMYYKKNIDFVALLWEDFAF
ncbi:hypothetical protein Tco_0981349 [Tanacetum coccineum]